MFSIFSLLFIGCPEPIDEKQGGNIDATELKNQSDQQGGVASDINGKSIPKLDAAPPSMGTFPGDLPEKELDPKFSQDDLKDGGVINGFVRCDDCAGQIIIRALPPPPEAGDGGNKDDMQLITHSTIEKQGAFSLFVPDNSTVVLQVVDDSNGDGRPNQGERMGMRGSGPLTVNGSVDGIELTVGVFPQKEPENGVTPPPDPVPGSNPEVEDGEPPEDNGASIEGEMPGGQVPGGAMPGGEMPGGQAPGGEMPGGQAPGGQAPGGQAPGGQAPGGPPADGPPADEQ